jgi:hypothetical protein
VALAAAVAAGVDEAITSVARWRQVGWLSTGVAFICVGRRRRAESRYTTTAAADDTRVPNIQ